MLPNCGQSIDMTTAPRRCNFQSGFWSLSCGTSLRAYRLDLTDRNVLRRLLVVLLPSSSNQGVLGMAERLGALGQVIKFGLLPETLVTLR